MGIYHLTIRSVFHFISLFCAHFLSVDCDMVPFAFILMPFDESVSSFIYSYCELVLCNDFAKRIEQNPNKRKKTFVTSGCIEISILQTRTINTLWKRNEKERNGKKSIEQSIGKSIRILWAKTKTQREKEKGREKLAQFTI